MLMLSLILLSGVLHSRSYAEEHRITSETELEKLCPKVVAGDSIVLQNGTWTDPELEFGNLTGTAESPITIRAKLRAALS